MNGKFSKLVEVSVQAVVIYAAMDLAEAGIKKVGKVMHDRKIKKGLKNEEA